MDRFLMVASFQSRNYVLINFSGKDMDMPENSVQIGYMSKVKVAIIMMGPRDLETNGQGPAIQEFVFGVGPFGLTPFETLLADKTEGDTIVMDGALLGRAPFCDSGSCLSFNNIADQRVQVQVQSVGTATNREVVKALAQGSGCGSGCDCGCGC